MCCMCTDGCWNGNLRNKYQGWNKERPHVLHVYGQMLEWVTKEINIKIRIRNNHMCCMCMDGCWNG